jgi:DHA1 family tetracycline resistance protein-like MFS transporter
LGGLLGAYGLRLPFMAAAAMAGINVLYGLLVLPESLPPERRRPIDWRRANALGSVRVVLADSRLTRLAIAWCCSWFALGALPSSFVLANELRFGWDTRHNGMAMALAGLGSAVVQGLLVRRINPALGERRAAMAGMLLTATGYFCIGVAPVGGFVLLGLVLQSMGAIGNPAVQALVSASASADRQGETQGALSSLQGLTAIVAPLIAVWLFSNFTHPNAIVLFPGAPFLASTVALCVGVWAIAGLRPVAALVRPEALEAGGKP